MLPGLFDLMIVGLLSITIGITVLLAMVHFELGPSARLAGKRRLLFAGALGSGVLAFALKLLLIIVIASFPQYVLDPFIDHYAPVSHRTNVPPPLDPVHYLITPLPPRAGQTPAPAPASPGDYVWESLPPAAPAPAHNPTTQDRVALGERLFLDKGLSVDGTVACASCHDVAGKAGADGLATARGIGGQTGQRNAPTVWNAAFQSVLFWDGRAASLEEQAMGPLVNPVEMGMPSLAAVEERVGSNEEYRQAFARVFGAEVPITIERITQAIAAYERTLVSRDTPYDRFVDGDLNALSPAQRRGMALFASSGCINCHYGPNFSAASLFDGRMPLRIFPVHATPLEQHYDLTGDGGAGTDANGRGVWRVPSLRNVALTGPWLHNGSVDELAEVVRIMASTQLGLSGHYLLWSDRDRVMNEINRPTLSDQAINDLVAFLHALSSDTLVAQAQAQRHTSGGAPAQR